jgi:hypothetical protein
VHLRWMDERSSCMIQRVHDGATHRVALRGVVRVERRVKDSRHSATHIVIVGYRVGLKVRHDRAHWGVAA